MNEGPVWCRHATRYRCSLALAVLGFLSTAPELACADYVTVLDVGINTLGSHTGNAFYVGLDKQPPTGCAYGLAYCMSSDPECKARLSILLTAKVTTRRLAYVWLNLDYANAVSGVPMCTLTNLAIN